MRISSGPLINAVVRPPMPLEPASRMNSAAPSFELGGGSMHIVNSEGKMVQSHGRIRISRARRFFRANSPQKKACAAQPNNGVRCPVKIFLAVYFLSAEHTLKNYLSYW